MNASHPADLRVAWKKPQRQMLRRYGGSIVAVAEVSQQVADFLIGLHAATDLGVTRSIESVVRIERKDPITGRVVDCQVLRSRKVESEPGPEGDLRAILASNVQRAVRRAGVDHHDLVRKPGNTVQAARQQDLLVLDHQAHAERLAAHANHPRNLRMDVYDFRDRRLPA